MFVIKESNTQNVFYLRLIEAVLEPTNKPVDKLVGEENAQCMSSTPVSLLLICRAITHSLCSGATSTPKECDINCVEYLFKS